MSPRVLRHLAGALATRGDAPQAAAASAQHDDDGEPTIVQMGADDFQEVCDCANLWFADHADFLPSFGRRPSQVYSPQNMGWHFGMRKNGQVSPPLPPPTHTPPL